VALAPAGLRTAVDEGGATDMKMEPGQTLWVEAGSRLRMENAGDGPAEFLRIELKTGKGAAQ
jgi:mannose-6-phosphate isomerase-like protein (cupin superfamily)